MSNSKWRRLFEALDRPELGLDQVIWKFVGRDAELRSAPPGLADLAESYVADSILSGFPYKEIEWLEIPIRSVPRGWEHVPQKHRAQDLDHILETIRTVGQFEIERRERGVRIYGWR